MTALAGEDVDRVLGRPSRELVGGRRDLVRRLGGHGLPVRRAAAGSGQWWWPGWGPAMT